MQPTPTASTYRPSLTPEEHARAEVLAYFISLGRGNGHEPPYDHDLAVDDFCKAAGDVIEKREGQNVNWYESGPLESDRDREKPIALRRYSRLDHRSVALDAFLEVEDELGDEEYWSLLGHIWTRAPKAKGQFDHRYSKSYASLFASERPGREHLMTLRERHTLLSLQNHITVFRGCQMGLNEAGLSWTLDKHLAEWFAYNYYPGGPRSVRKGVCNTSDVIAYFNYDKEREVVIQPENVANQEKIND